MYTTELSVKRTCSGFCKLLYIVYTLMLLIESLPILHYNLPHYLLPLSFQGILRIIYAFYTGLTRAESPYVSVPLNCVLELIPSAFTCSEKVYVQCLYMCAVCDLYIYRYTRSVKVHDFYILCYIILLSYTSFVYAVQVHTLYVPEEALPHDGQTETKPFNHDPQSHQGQNYDRCMYTPMYVLYYCGILCISGGWFRLGQVNVGVVYVRKHNMQLHILIISCNYYYYNHHQVRSVKRGQNYDLIEYMM